MALGRTRRATRGFDYWPGFVDALSTMLLVIIFLLSVFMLSQFFLSREVANKDSALTRLTRQIEDLTSLLALERTSKAETQAHLASLTATLAETERSKQALLGQIDAAKVDQANLGGQVAASTNALAAEKQISAQAAAQVDLLNQQIAALRQQLAAIETALATSEQKGKEAEGRIADLGARLNVALAQKVQELARYRSDFFGRLRQILGSRPGVRVVGDRFVFESEVLFDTGQATINPQGQAQIEQLAVALKQLEGEIPAEIAWVMRVDGHTDKRPVAGLFRSNWDLSAARAISVVQLLVSKGVSPQHLVAAGFGEFQPVDAGDSEDALRRNRRIELKLTER